MLADVAMHVDQHRNLAVGAAYGTAKAGVGIAGIGSFRPELIMKVGVDDSVHDHAVHTLTRHSSRH
jgi:hypothetical protein